MKMLFLNEYCIWHINISKYKIQPRGGLEIFLRTLEMFIVQTHLFKMHGFLWPKGANGGSKGCS